VARQKVTFKALGDAVGVSPQRVSALVKRGAPCTSAAEFKAWCEGNLHGGHRRGKQPGKKSAADDIGEDKTTSDLVREKLAEEVAMKRLKRLQAQGELVSRRAIKAEFAKVCATIRARLEAIPEEIGTAAPPDLQAQFIADTKNKIRLVLMELQQCSVAQ